MRRCASAPRDARSAQCVLRELSGVCRVCAHDHVVQALATLHTITRYPLQGHDKLACCCAAKHGEMRRMCGRGQNERLRAKRQLNRSRHVQRAACFQSQVACARCHAVNPKSVTPMGDERAFTPGDALLHFEPLKAARERRWTCDEQLCIYLLRRDPWRMPHE